MGFRDPYFLYIILCNQKEVKIWQITTSVSKMDFIKQKND